VPSTSERIRDKIAASKRKGLWVGGMDSRRRDAADREQHSEGDVDVKVRDLGALRQLF